jgi:hypothetical protein
MSALCLAAGAAKARLVLTAFTLAWTHSVEKIPWQEAWRIENGKLVLVEAWVEGSGAGMEVPEGAIFENGAWHYHPHLPPLPSLTLARSGATADWRLCVSGSCRTLGQILHLPPTSQPVVARPCP